MNTKTRTLRTSVAILALAIVACGEDATQRAPANGPGAAEGGDPGDEAPVWGASCQEDAQCAAPTDFCVLQPGTNEGYCSIKCPNLGADCTFEDWTCNIVGVCDSPTVTWCGPPSEIEDSGGFLVACE